MRDDLGLIFVVWLYNEMETIIDLLKCAFEEAFEEFYVKKNEAFKLNSICKYMNNFDILYKNVTYKAS